MVPGVQNVRSIHSGEHKVTVTERQQQTVWSTGRTFFSSFESKCLLYVKAVITLPVADASHGVKRFLTPWTGIFLAFHYDQPVFILHNSKIDINHDIPKCISLNNISFRFVYIRDNVTRTFLKWPLRVCLFFLSLRTSTASATVTFCSGWKCLLFLLNFFFPFRFNSISFYFCFLAVGGTLRVFRCSLSAPHCHIETTFRQHCITYELRRYINCQPF